jgi:hypothetical protein
VHSACKPHVSWMGHKAMDVRLLMRVPRTAEISRRSAKIVLRLSWIMLLSERLMRKCCCSGRRTGNVLAHCGLGST